MSKMELTLDRMAKVTLRLETCRNEWARQHWISVREQLRRRLEVAELEDLGVISKIVSPKTPLLAPRGYTL
jgi:hypothetical protein